MAHADVFELGTTPDFVFILFGGSGVDEEDYQRHSRTVYPVLAKAIGELWDDGMNIVLVHIAAPYDVPFNRFSVERAAAATWSAHVLDELLEPWRGLPYFVSGFSGGAVLALNGLHQNPRCFGGAAMGADAIPDDFVCPDHWEQTLQLYASPNDPVCNHPANRRVVESLARDGQLQEVRLRRGGHRLADYATRECLGELLRFAHHLNCGTQKL